jgi:hypothetical protein
MSRVMTMSELYSLMLSDQAMVKPVGASAREKNPMPTQVALNERVPMLWVNPARHQRTAAVAAPLHQMGVVAATQQALAAVAAACGISASDAWTEAANLWIAQRQRDMEELATPSGQALAGTVMRVWSVIDDQMRELRGEAVSA